MEFNQIEQWWGTMMERNDSLKQYSMAMTKHNGHNIPLAEEKWSMMMMEHNGAQWITITMEHEQWSTTIHMQRKHGL